jgi:cytochrome c peroxidase
MQRNQEQHRQRGAPGRVRPWALLCLFGILSGCLREPATSPDPEVPEGEVFGVTLPAGWPPLVWPKENPYSKAKAELGQDLFFNFGLSRDGLASCAWCHTPLSGFTDSHHGPFSTGVLHQLTRRNTPTLANLAFVSSFTYDGRDSTLEAQALGPLLSPHEMDMTGPEIVARLEQDTHYVNHFREAYGEGPITLDRIVKALATYQRTLISYRSPYDRWRAGDENALAPEMKRGAALFFGDKLDCRRCHVPPLFTDGEFHNTGLDSVTTDPGRAGVTGSAADEGRFKTPTLRNVEMSSPYMHDGRFYGLEEVLRHYNSGGKPHPGADSLMRPLGLTAQEITDLAAFLESLTDEAFMEITWH